MRKLHDELVILFNSDLPSDKLREGFLDYHASDITQVFEKLNPEARARFYRIFDIEQLALIVSFSEELKAMIPEIPRDLFSGIIANLDTLLATDVLAELEEFDSELAKEVVNALPLEIKEEIEEIQSYDEDEVGHYMTNSYIAINKDLSIKATMKKVIELADSTDNIMTVFAIDKNGIYQGLIPLVDLIVARDNSSLSEIIKTSHPYLRGYNYIDEHMDVFTDYGLESIPVLNSDDKLIGIIPNDTMIEILTQEREEDLVKFGGVSEEEELETSTFFSIRKRTPWLVMLLGLSLLIALVISRFEAVLLVVPIMIFFQSMILDMAGNVGTQALAVTIRFLEDEKMSKKEVRRQIFKETKLGFINGIILAVVGFIVVFAFLWIRKQSSFHGEFLINDSLMLSGVISVSLLGGMTISSLCGAFIPIFLKKLKADPAVASGPFITTINDLLAVLLYYGITFALLGVLGLL